MRSRYSTVSGRGRDYYPERPSAAPLKPGDVVPTDTYMERGQRWMEKEEAVSLREAMEDMNVKDEPKDGDNEGEGLYQAALDEASELVWQHQNGIKPPQPGTPYRYKQHLRKNSYAHARTASVGQYGDDIVPSGMARDPSSRSVSSSSTSSGGFGSRRSRLSYSSTVADVRPSQDEPRDGSMDSARSKAYSGLASGPRPMASQSGRRRSSMKRNISGEIAKPFSGDQIFEEPASSTFDSSAPGGDRSGDPTVQPLRLKAKDPLNRVVQFAPDVPPSPETPPSKMSKVVSKYEIHRNPPSQSRNPQYVINTNAERPAGAREEVPKKHGVEIRSDDIRQATSMRLKDRSAKLPTPSYVSDNPGRPIVSFDAKWKAPEEAATDEKPDPRKGGGGGFRGRQAPQAPQTHQIPPIPSIAVMESPQPPQAPFSRRGPPPPSIQVDGPSSTASRPQPPIPSIAVSDVATPPVPSIVLPDDGGAVDNRPSIPVIVTPDDDQNIPVIIPPGTEGDAASSSSSPSRRPLPTPGASAGGRSRPAVRPRGHWSPAPQPFGNRATACCHECTFPIEGRFIALKGSSERFHPQCFRCYVCGTCLEALEISPEPEPARAARLDRIRRRTAGDTLAESPGETMGEDGDARLRFYCHLDWHELFAPRCKHCKTPILGEHVVALGAHWHSDHFFCAECGDPFGSGATHIEKDGYAWCVRCQTQRTERRAPKCKACSRAVIGTYVQALGGEWHDECFRCAVCRGGFDDGQIFTREGDRGMMQVVCTSCRQRELKA